MFEASAMLGAVSSLTARLASPMFPARCSPDPSGPISMMPMQVILAVLVADSVLALSCKKQASPPCTRNLTSRSYVVAKVLAIPKLRACYFMMADSMNETLVDFGNDEWGFSVDKARGLCKSLNTTLLSIQTRGENTTVKKLAGYAPLGMKEVVPVSGVSWVPS